MTTGPLIKLTAPTAAAICANFEARKEATALLRDGMTVQEFVGALFDKKFFVDAIDFMAHALPAREGIWWGCLCMQHALGQKLSPAEIAAATAAVEWVLRPNEDSRAAAQGRAEIAGPGSPAGSLAMAAALTGGSMAPPNLPPKPPPPFAPAKSIAMAVKIATTKSEPINIPKIQRCYVELALEVAEGRLI